MSRIAPGVWGCHALEAAAALTYSYKGQDEQMEESDDKRYIGEKDEENQKETKMYKDTFLCIM